MKFNGDFIGHDSINTTRFFSGSDKEVDFNKNKAKLPSDWHYQTNPISYSFNEYGHRSKNVNEIDLDNYILFTGCSHTFGVGLELEKTYSYLTAKKLGTDYYNLALGSTGIDVLEYNLLTWFAKVKKKPKHVIIQWPEHSRFVSLKENYGLFTPIGVWSHDIHNKNLIVQGEDTGMFYARKELSRLLIEQTIDVPLHTFNFGMHVAYGTRSSRLKAVDRARDLAHPGIKSNEIFTDLIYKTIVNHK